MKMKKHDVCPTCLSKDLIYFDSILFENIKLDYFRCRRCDLIFMGTMPTQSWYNNFYATAFWEDKSKKQTNSLVQYNTKQWKKELAWADKFISFLRKEDIKLRKNSLILEIGCAYGLIAHSVAHHFCSNAIGVEPSRSARDFSIRHSNVKIIAENMDQLSKWNPSTPVDMVICSHVIENIVDLELVFSTINRILDKEGYLLLDTPNIFFQNALSIYHPYCFCKKSISTLLNKFGFKVIASKASGRAKNLLTPKFLTIIAQKTEKNINYDIKEDLLFNTKLFFSRLWGKFTLFKLVKIADQYLHSIVFPPSKYNINTINRIKKEILKKQQ